MTLPALNIKQNKFIKLAGFTSLVTIILLALHARAPLSLADPSCGNLDCQCGCECLWEGGFQECYCLPCEPDDSGGGPCFTGETLIAGEADGITEIKALNVGDVVKSFNYESGVVGTSRVVSLHEQEVQEYFILKTESGREVRVTGDHPFWAEKILEGKCLIDFVKVKDLEPGDTSFFLGRDCEGVVEACLLEDKITGKVVVREPIEVYNLTVDSDSTYFANDFAVHNKGPILRAYFFWDIDGDGCHDDTTASITHTEYATYCDNVDSRAKEPGTELVEPVVVHGVANVAPNPNLPLMEEGDAYANFVSDYGPYQIFNSSIVDQNEMYTVHGKIALGAMKGGGGGATWTFGQTIRGADLRVGGLNFADYPDLARPGEHYSLYCWREASDGESCLSGYKGITRVGPVSRSVCGTSQNWSDFKPEKDYGGGEGGFCWGQSDSWAVQIAEFTADYSGQYYFGQLSCDHHGGEGRAGTFLFRKDSGDWDWPARIADSSVCSIYGVSCEREDPETYGFQGAYLGKFGCDSNPVLLSLTAGQSYVMVQIYNTEYYYSTMQSKSGFPFWQFRKSMLRTTVPNGEVKEAVAAIPLVKVGAGPVIGTLRGRVWNDVNVSCADEYEDGIPAATLYLDNWGGDSRSSASDGNYNFGEVSIGTHRVYIEPPSGYIFPPNCLENYLQDTDGHYYLEVEVPAGGEGVANFGLFNVGVLGCVSKTMQAFGSGIMQQPGEMNFSVPNVSEARLYWSYRTRNEVEDNALHFENSRIHFSGELVGNLLGTPTGTELTAYSYGTDIASYLSASPTVNDVLVSDIYNESESLAEGSGVIVISETLPDQLQTIQLHEANDYFHWSFDDPNSRSGVYNFDLCAEADDPTACAAALNFYRNARLVLMVAGRDPYHPRASKVWLWSGMEPLGEGEDVIGHSDAVVVSEDPLYRGVGYNGDSFNTIVWESGEEGLNLIPKAHRYVSLQIESPDPSSHPEGWDGESMTVVAIGLETSCIPEEFPPFYEEIPPRTIKTPIMPMCADVTQSGSIDLDDTRTIVGQQNLDLSSCNDDVCRGDINNDGVVNAFDFSLSVTQQGTSCGS